MEHILFILVYSVSDLKTVTTVAMYPGNLKKNQLSQKPHGSLLLNITCVSRNSVNINALMICYQ